MCLMVQGYLVYLGSGAIVAMLVPLECGAPLNLLHQGTMADTRVRLKKKLLLKTEYLCNEIAIVMKFNMPNNY